MMSKLLALTGLFAATLADTAVFTPHVQFSSSMGVLGCKINTNRVGYLPSFPGCDNLCVKVSYQSRSTYILHVDQSGGAHDISADAFRYLITGLNGTDAENVAVPSDPTEMDYSVVSMDSCNDLIYTEDKMMPIIAVSPTAVVNCKANEPNSYLATNFVLLNYANSCCTLGYDEACYFTTPYYGGAQPVCDGKQLGLQTPCETKALNLNMDGEWSQAVC